jgi:DNA-binding Xre family transcriptional regulator
MKNRGFSTYTLRFKFGISHATVQRLQSDQPISTHTLDKLCELLDCKVEEVLEYIPASKQEKE